MKEARLGTSAADMRRPPRRRDKARLVCRGLISLGSQKLDGANGLILWVMSCVIYMGVAVGVFSPYGGEKESRQCGVSVFLFLLGTSFVLALLDIRRHIPELIDYLADIGEQSDD